MTAPSNSAPRPVLKVVGEKAFQMIDSQMLVAMKSEMPLPSPYPFWSKLVEKDDNQSGDHELHHQEHADAPAPKSDG